jgi:hypothetical protein
LIGELQPFGNRIALGFFRFGAGAGGVELGLRSVVVLIERADAIVVCLSPTQPSTGLRQRRVRFFDSEGLVGGVEPRTLLAFFDDRAHLDVEQKKGSRNPEAETGFDT